MGGHGSSNRGVEAKTSDDMMVLFLVEEAEIINTMIVIRMTAMNIAISNLNKEEEEIVHDYQRGQGCGYFECNYCHKPRYKEIKLLVQTSE